MAIHRWTALRFASLLVPSPLLWSLVLAVGAVRPAAAQGLTVRPEASARLTSAVTALSVADDMLLAGDARGHVAVWTLDGMEPVLRSEVAAPVVFIGAASGDSVLVVVDARGGISLRALPGGEVLTALRVGFTPVLAAMDAGRQVLAVGEAGDRITLFDLRAGARPGVIDARDVDGDVVFLGFDRLGQQLVAISERAEVVSWNPVTLQPLRRLDLQGASIHGSRSRIHAAAANRAANVFVVGLEEVALPKGGIGRAARPGDLVRRDLVVVYDWNSGIEVGRVEVPTGPVELLALGPGTDFVAVAERHRATVRFLHLRGAAPGAALTVESEPETVLVTEDGRRLVIGTEEGHVSTWRLAYTEEGTPEEALPSLAGRIRSIGEASPALTADRPGVLAVLPFDDRLGSEQVAQLVAEALVTRLANVTHLTLVERLRIDAILDEFALLEQGLTVADGLQVGKLLNADYVLLGSIGAFGPNYLFNARVLDVETGQVISGRQVLCEECRQQDLFDAIGVLSRTIAR